MQINLNRKKPFFFCRKIKETSLSIMKLTSSAYYIKGHRKENPSPPPPSFLIDNEDINTIKTNHQPSSSSSLSSFMFPSPTLTVTTLQNNDRNNNEDVPETGDDEEEDVKEFDHLKSANGLYSNFYLKLPNGKWLVKVRTRERKILGMYELDASMI